MVKSSIQFVLIQCSELADCLRKLLITETQSIKKSSLVYIFKEYINNQWANTHQISHSNQCLNYLAGVYLECTDVTSLFARQLSYLGVFYREDICPISPKYLSGVGMQVCNSHLITPCTSI